jgi:predicted transcriptional regulator
MRRELRLQFSPPKGLSMPNLPPAAKYKAQARPVADNTVQATAGDPNQTPPGIIPVGQEPRRRPTTGEHNSGGAFGLVVAAAESILREKPSRNTTSRAIHSPEKLFRLRDRLLTLRIFTLETMGSLRRAEIAVWLAIFNCEFRGQAQIGYTRIEDVTGLSRKHVGKAIKSLVEKGLLEVISRGQYRPRGKTKDNGTGENGLSSIYRLHPREANREGDGAPQPKPRKPKRPR